jgi:hypothetical protein
MLLLALTWPLLAQEQSTDPNDMFEEDVVQEAEGPTASDQGPPAAAVETAPEEVFLTSTGLRWGGSFEASFDSTLGWVSYQAACEKPFEPAAAILTSAVKAAVHFDARPTRDFRVFGKAGLEYGYDGAAWGWEASVRELFADFQWKDWAFFRVGKHMIQWGVGYFYSPADVLNLVSIDPKDPTAEREGPISLKTHVPFGQNNAYLYLIANDVSNAAEIGVAPKLEVVLGGYELAAGGFFQQDLPAGLMIAGTGPLGKLDLFGEAVLQYAWKLASAPLIFSGTFGAGYRDPELGVTVFAQYLYAEGVPAAADLPAARAAFPGTHRLAALAAWSPIGESDFGLSVLYLANLSDGSGLVQPTASWQPLKWVLLSVGAGMTYGPAESELAPAGPVPTLTLKLTVKGAF